MNANPRNIFIGMVVVAVLIVFAAYRFAYTPNVEEAEKISNENKSLESRKAELNEKMTNKPMYDEGILTSTSIIESTFEKYGPGNTPEKTIMMIVDLCNKTGMQIGQLGLNGEENVYSSSAKDENGNPKYSLYRTTITISGNGGYTQLKKMFDYVNNYPERMNVENFSMNFSMDSGKVTTSAVINLYAAKDANHEYVAPAIENIPIGVENIFTHFVQAEEGEEGLEEGLENGEEGASTGDIE